MGLTCDASLARNLPSSEPSRLRDRPRSQVEAVVLQVPASRSSEPWTARTNFLYFQNLFLILNSFLLILHYSLFQFSWAFICFPILSDSISYFYELIFFFCCLLFRFSITSIHIFFIRFQPFLILRSNLLFLFCFF